MKKQFDRFVLTGTLAYAAGGAALYAAQEQLPGGVTRPVAVKVLPPLAKSDPGGEKRFVDEVRVLAQLAGNPHVVTFYGMGITEGVPWVAMEQAPATLAGSLGLEPGDPAEVARVVEHVARGLEALHALVPVLLHNRLQPGNVLAWAGDHYKVAEFGLAAPPAAEPTLGIDSVRYAAPELLNKEFGRAGPSSDLYALGHIAYELALGAKIHRQQFPAVMEGSNAGRDVNPAKWQAWHYSLPTAVPAAHELVKGFPPRLGEVIAKLMAKPLASRYGSAAEVIADLRGGGGAMGAAHGQPTSAAPMAAVAPPAAAPGRPSFRPAASAAPLPAPPPMDLPAAGRSAPSFTATRQTAAAAAPTPAGAAGGERYFVRLRNQTSGPFDVAALQRLVRQGQLSRLHQVSTDQRTWKSAGSVEGLLG